MSNNLRNILNRQKEMFIELENEVTAIENSDLTKENERLKAELEKLSLQYSKSNHSVKTLSEQNASLKNALYEQIYNEKLQITKLWENKIKIYFQSNAINAVNKLDSLESSIKSRIDYMTLMLNKSHIDTKDDIYDKLDELSRLANHKITEAKKQFAENHGAFSQNERAEFESLKNEQITDEQVVAVTKKNNLERFVGLNLLNIIGVLLIIIGSVAFSNFLWGGMHNTLKGIMLFSLGGVMLVTGELLNRKKPNIFSLGITSGGVAVLYIALATSYFGLKILYMYPAIALCVLITAAAFFLSTRYNSQTILALALVGGYLPLISIGTDKTMIYGAMVYFVVLNLLALLVSFKKKWTIASFVGVFLNIIGTIYVCLNFGYSTSIQEKIIVITYIMFAFLIYTLIPVLGTYKNKLKFTKSDVVLLAINTFVSSVIIYNMFNSFKWHDFTGTLAIIFSVIYLSLGWLVEHKFDGEKNTQSLFYLTGFTFVVLIIPFQFGELWLTLGWLVEGVAITVYGILKDKKIFKRVGFVINTLCLSVFLFFDVTRLINYLFAYKYLAITLGSLIILGSYIYKKTLSSRFQRFYKYAAIINLWFYAIYISLKLFDKLRLYYYNIDYLAMSLAIFLTFAIAYISPRIKILSDTGMKIISCVLYFIGIAWLFVINGYTSPYCGEVPLLVKAVGTSVLVGISLLSVFSMHDMIKLIIMGRKLGVEWYPLIVSAYFVIILTQNLTAQYNLSFASMWISIIYVLTALAWIIFGFVKRYSFIRKFGLGLALLAVIKLFVIDLAHLTTGYQIVSYFALGITLLAISYVYQYFNKRLELKTEVADDASQDN